MDRDVLHMIEARLQSFSKGKQQIATYILHNPNEAAFQTAALIGKAVGISESSVVRFAGDLGFKGFPDFQKELQQVAMQRLRCNSPSHEDPKEVLTPFDPIYSQGVRELLQCRGLFFLADTPGSTLFPYCKLWADTAGETVSFLTCHDNDALFMGLAQMQPGDILLTILLQDPSPVLSFAVEQAKKLGGRNLILTSSLDPILREHGDVLFCLPRQTVDDPIPDLSSAASALHKLFTDYLSEKRQAVSKHNRILEEIRNAYEMHKS